MSRYSRENQINCQWTEEYLNEAHSLGLTSVRCHVNVLAWSEDPAELARIKMVARISGKPLHLDIWIL